jgi:hypothetical protein
MYDEEALLARFAALRAPTHVPTEPSAVERAAAQARAEEDEIRAIADGLGTGSGEGDGLEDLDELDAFMAKLDSEQSDEHARGEEPGLGEVDGVKKNGVNRAVQRQLEREARAALGDANSMLGSVSIVPFSRVLRLRGWEVQEGCEGWFQADNTGDPTKRG